VYIILDLQDYSDIRIVLNDDSGTLYFTNESEAYDYAERMLCDYQVVLLEE
jgi:hypothetical protein